MILKLTPRVRVFRLDSGVDHRSEVAGTRSIDILCFVMNRYHTDPFFASLSQEFPSIHTLDFRRYMSDSFVLGERKSSTLSARYNSYYYTWLMNLV
jgi:hypothetical protein